MENPNPKKFKVKKLRDKHSILVDKQILRWRTALKKKGITSLLPPKEEKPVESPKEATSTPSFAPLPTPAWNPFK